MPRVRLRLPARSPRRVNGELWAIRADQGRALLTAAEWHAAAGRYESATHCLARAQNELAEAEIDCLARVRERTLGKATKGFEIDRPKRARGHG